MERKTQLVDQWDLIDTKVNRAVVFIDNPSAECLHWSGGAVRLLRHGAIDVKELSSFESAQSGDKKAVFITSSLLFDTTASIIRDITESSCFQYIIAITSQSSQHHLFAKTGSTEGDDKDVFFQFEEKLLEWMGNVSFTAEVIHVPFGAVPILPSLFLLPAYDLMNPLLPGDHKKIEFHLNKGKIGERKKIESLSDVEFSLLPELQKIQYMGIVSAINSLMDQLNVRDDCYAIGNTSRILATELANYAPARGRRKSATNKASILFIDRTLDLTGPFCHLGESIADKICNMLPCLPLHRNDVCVNMANLCSIVSDDNNQSVIVPGCLAQDQKSKSADLLNYLVLSKQKEALMEVNKRLVEAAMKENLPLKMSGKPGRITADQLDSHVKLFKGNSQVIQKHSGLLQIANAVIQTLRHEQYGRYDALQSIEKLLLQNMGDEDCPSAVNQITLLLDKEMQKPLNERELNLEEVLHLLIFSYSLVEDVAHSMREEDLLKELLATAITTELDLPETLDSIFEDSKNVQKVRSTLDDIFCRLRSVGSARKGLKKFGQIYDPGSMTSPGSYRPLIQQIVEEIFNPNKPDLVDVEYKSSGLKDLLKTGFGYFMSVSKPRLNDHPLLVIFVVGGVTNNEVKQIQDTVSKFDTNTEIIIGSTCLAKPAYLADSLFLRGPLDTGSV